jgi:signal transduction histidine kinase
VREQRANALHHPDSSLTVPATVAPRGAKRIGVVLGPALVVALVGAGTLWNIRDVTDRENWIRHTDQVKLVAADFLAQLSTSRTAVNKFLISGDTADISQYRVVADSANLDLASLRTLTADNPNQRPRLDELDRLAVARFADIDTTIRVRQSRGEATAAAMSLVPGRALMDTAREVGAALTAEEDLLLMRRTPALNRRRSLTVTVLVIGTGIALLLGVLANTYLLRAAALSATQNEQLRKQAQELETQNDQLQEQAAEMEIQADQLQRQTAELEAANTAKSDFLTSMSHELRTPLNAISGYADLLDAGIRGPLLPPQLEDIQRIRRASAHLLALINDVLNVARLEAGHVEVADKPVLVEPLLIEAAAMLEPQAHAKGVVFERVRCDADYTVAGDRDRILQILLNLLSNAVKFTAPGGRVTLACQPSEPAGDGRIWIVVRDTGRGIPADQMLRVFEPFVQVGRKLSGTDEGAGLGLTISRDLARAMNGDLVAESRETVGSSFTLVLVSAAPAGVMPSPDASRDGTDDRSRAGDGVAARVEYADTDSR